MTFEGEQGYRHRALGLVNEVFNPGILDSLKGVIDSIGDSALKAGQGFSLLADAIIRLVGETGFFDLAATLTAVAGAVGDIAKTGKNAGDAYKNLEKLIETLTKLANTEFDQLETDLQSVDDKLYVITIYTPTLKDTKTNLDDIGKVRLTTLNNDLDNANTKVGTFQTTVQNAFTSISSTISDKLNTISNDITGKLKTIAQTFKDQTASWKTTAARSPPSRSRPPTARSGSTACADAISRWMLPESIWLWQVIMTAK